MTLSSRAYTVVGVMPPGFGMPSGDSQVWVPMPCVSNGSARPVAEPNDISDTIKAAQAR